MFTLLYGCQSFAFVITKLPKTAKKIIIAYFSDGVKLSFNEGTSKLRVLQFPRIHDSQSFNTPRERKVDWNHIHSRCMVNLYEVARTEGSNDMFFKRNSNAIKVT